MEKGVLRNFTKFTGKHLCQSLFFNKVAGLRHRCSPVNDTYIGTRIWHAFWHVSTQGRWHVNPADMQARWHGDHVPKQARMARDLGNSVDTIYIKTRYFV